ncbi:MAG: hypothetical protein EAY65_02915 [Alphaproteobacteria bacterium]|nr:MAG: hypothetical protein EAY65_02915 [Alphaproteobacteria bacterium]
MQHKLYQWENSTAGIANLEISKTSFGRKQAVLRFKDEVDAAALKNLPEALNKAGITAFPELDPETNKVNLVMYGFGNEARIMNIMQTHRLVDGPVQTQTFDVPTPEEIAEKKMRQEDGLIASGVAFVDRHALRIQAVVGMVGHGLTGLLGVKLGDSNRVANGIFYGASTSIQAIYGSGQDEINFQPVMYKTSKYLEGENISFDSHVAGADADKNALQKLNQVIHDNAFALSHAIGGFGDIAQLLSGLADKEYGWSRVGQGASSMIGCLAQIFCDEAPVDMEEMKYKNAVEQGLAFVNAHPLALAGNINLWQNIMGVTDALNMSRKLEDNREMLPGKIFGTQANAIDSYHGVNDEKMGKAAKALDALVKTDDFKNLGTPQAQQEFLVKHAQSAYKGDTEIVSMFAQHGNDVGELRTQLNDRSKERLAAYKEAEEVSRHRMSQEDYKKMKPEEQAKALTKELNEKLSPEKKKDALEVKLYEVEQEKDRLGKNSGYTKTIKALQDDEKDRRDLAAANSEFAQGNTVRDITLGVTALYALSSYLNTRAHKTRPAEFSNDDAYLEMYARVAQAIVALPEEKRDQAIDKASVFLASQKEVKLTSDHIAEQVRVRVDAFEKAPWLDIETSKERVLRKDMALESRKSEQRVEAGAHFVATPKESNNIAVTGGLPLEEKGQEPKDKVSDIAYGQRVVAPEQLAAVRMA